MKKQLWKRDAFVGLAVVVFFLLSTGSHWVGWLDNAAYDLGVRFSSARPANENVVVVGIDDASLRALGPWPWSRSVLAAVSREVAADGAVAIGITLPLNHHQNLRGLETVRELRKAVEAQAKTSLRRALRHAEDELDTDGKLAGSLRRAGNVLLAVDYHTLGSGEGSTALPAYLARESLTRFPAGAEATYAYLTGLLHQRAIPQASTLAAPIDTLGQAAAGAGFARNQDLSPADGVRAVPLVVRYDTHYYPSLALLLVARTLHINPLHARPRPGIGLGIDDEVFRTDPALYAYPYFYRDRDGKPPFAVYSFADVAAHKVPAARFKGKTVLLGLTATNLAPRFDTPLGTPLPAVMIAAHTVSSLLNRDLFTVPEWTFKAQLLALAIVAFYLMVVLPRFRLSTGLALTLVLLIVVLNVHFILMLTDATWVPLMGPAAALVMGYMLLAGKRLVAQRIEGMQEALSDANRQLGLSFQAQGQLDQAFQKYRQCMRTVPLLDALYTLGLDYERRRQFNKAVSVFLYLSEQDKTFRDVTERIERNQELERMSVLGKGGGNSSAGTLIISNNGVQKPMLGRYQIERELGRGAMGLVYLGRDPKIGRTVAIKTMALSQEFGSEQFEEVRQRFFREAETAGRLNHPHIVTIYDVGEDQDLAYIAMDYLKGENLLTYCKADNLLPTEQVFDIIIQVGEALEYAHSNNVVHRDVKPANIIYDAETGSVNVTDFGVAHLIDASKTRTGTILGSPSYMSPEQLAGKRVDGRSDIFSLGVTLYQMLTGELPFIGESLASLMYKIANEKHPDLRMFRPDLPPCASKVVNKALFKEIDKRFQSGLQMANALRRCREKLGQQVNEVQEGA